MQMELFSFWMKCYSFRVSKGHDSSNLSRSFSFPLFIIPTLFMILQIHCSDFIIIVSVLMFWERFHLLNLNSVPRGHKNAFTLFEFVYSIFLFPLCFTVLWSFFSLHVIPFNILVMFCYTGTLWAYVHTFTINLYLMDFFWFPHIIFA